MALLFLETGQQVYVDDEDYEACCAYKWRVWTLRPSGRLCIWAIAKINNRKFDLFLHRLIAVRMTPEAAKRGFKVHPRDGDYFNCRRENLEVAVHQKRRWGPVPKPGGSRTRRGTRNARDTTVIPDDLALLWNPVKHKVGRKKHARSASGSAGPASPEVGRDP